MAGDRRCARLLSAAFAILILLSACSAQPEQEVEETAAPETGETDWVYVPEFTRLADWAGCFALAGERARKEGADFILGSDPDADRVGIMVRNDKGEYMTITGNQTGVLLLDYLIGAKRRAGKMPDEPVALKTIVTTEMARRVAEVNGLKCYDTFTGFKFLAQKKDQLEESGEGKVIFSYEESYGYMLGDYVRDKDAVSASVELTEMAAWYASQGMTLYDALQALFEKYGYYGEKTLNLVMPGLDGLKKMAALMAGLREAPPAESAGGAGAQQ